MINNLTAQEKVCVGKCKIIFLCISNYLLGKMKNILIPILVSLYILLFNANFDLKISTGWITYKMKGKTNWMELTTKINEKIQKVTY